MCRAFMRNGSMFQRLINVRRILGDWLQAGRNHTEAARRTRILPAWVALGVVLVDFVLIGLSFRYMREMSIMEGAGAGVMVYLLRLSIVTATLVFVCRYYRVSGVALGIRPSKMAADFRWSSRICIFWGSTIAGAILAGFVIARCLGIRLPAPPALMIQVLGDNYGLLQFIGIAALSGIVVVVLAPVTEELIYRSVCLPVLACRIGLVPAIGITAIIFGLAHVIPFGQVWIPVPEIIGGLLMAAGFAIRWSVIPAMVIHAMGNLVASMLLFIYVHLFKAYPSWFGSP